jgi:DNA-binding NarL/FixJ family response regulator
MNRPILTSPLRTNPAPINQHMSLATLPLATVIVEDNPALLELLAGMLGCIDGIALQGTAASEAEAISLIRATRPRLAIVDLELREGTGLNVLRAIQSRPADFGAPRTVVFSNHAHPIVRSRCLALGAEAFFDKSFQMDELLEFVQGLANASA